MAEVIRDCGANISRIAVFRENTEKALVVIRLTTEDGDSVTKALRERGYNIVSVDVYEELQP